MCEFCGCSGPDAVTGINGHHVDHADPRVIPVLQDLLQDNDRLAGHIRAHFDAHGVFAVNLMSAPGSGKTSLLEATIGRLPAGLRVGVIEGDLETENDAERIRRHGIPAVQITTGMACHLDAQMVHDALHVLDLDALDIVFIENIGNLVCPANFDLGQHRNVLLLSVTEGDDKPAKYPVMFRAADQVLITKADLLPYITEFDPARARDAIHTLRQDLPVTELSAKTGAGLDPWIDWLVRTAAAVRPAATVPA